MSSAPTSALPDFDSFNATGESVMTVLIDGAPILFEGKPITITLFGIDSDQFRRAALFQRNRQKKDQMRGRLDGLAESEDSSLIESLAAATKGWSAMPRRGVNVEFSRENCKAAYRELHWLREQVGEFVGSRSNFTKGSQTN